jgi:parvulin-like peptidyl-prolyl isomerase
MRKYLIGALAIWLGLAIAGGTAWAQAKAGQAKPAAVVNGEVIPLDEFESMYAKGPGAQPNLTPEQHRFLRNQMLQTLIDETLFQQFLRKNVPAPDPSVAQQRVAELEKSLKARGKSLRQFYEESGQSPERLQRDINAVVQWNAYVKKHVTDEDTKKYYEDNKELFDGVMIRASQVFIRAARDADPKVQTEARQRLLAVRQQALSGADFAELARKHGQDATAASGGDLGYFPPSGKTEQDPFLRTVSAMKVNEISHVVQTDYGFHLIKVTDRKAGKPSTYEDAKDDARVLVSEELRVKIIEDMRKTAKIEIGIQDK